MVWKAVLVHFVGPISRAKLMASFQFHMRPGPGNAPLCTHIPTIYSVRAHSMYVPGSKLYSLTLSADVIVSYYIFYNARTHII